MGEVEFFDKVKNVNRLLTSEAREQIWKFILEGEFVSVKSIRSQEEVLNDILIRKSIKEEGL